MNIWLILALTFAALEALALQKNWNWLEYVAKPAVVLCLFVWLYLATGLQGVTLWFGLGILFSLVGDILLMILPDRMFLYGLTAFLFAHVSYLVGFQNELMQFSAWSMILIVILASSAIRVIRRIVSAMRAQGQDRLVYPVTFYSLVITTLLYAAMTTISNPEWKTGASFLVSAGAFLFFISDVILAWNKFVTPIKNGRILNIAAYHLGQIGLIAGVIIQYGK